MRCASTPTRRACASDAFSACRQAVGALPIRRCASASPYACPAPIATRVNRVIDGANSPLPGVGMVCAFTVSNCKPTPNHSSCNALTRSGAMPRNALAWLVITEDARDHDDGNGCPSALDIAALRLACDICCAAN
ncbi:hypothetical protein G6F62_015236 [Rhizopus arrhizus]|nr:hypothetical protein G6F62_015236 [Rhizopus arrhizus]